MSTLAAERAATSIARLAQEHHDLATFWQEASAVIAPVVPNYQGPCWYTLDPVSLLVTSHFNPYMPELPADAFVAEYYEDDVNKLADVARSAGGLSTLHEATGGDPSSSPRWRANMLHGGDQELIAALRTHGGQAWGALGVYREPGRPMFNDVERRFIRTAAPHLAEGARRALLIGEATEPDAPDAPGLVVFSTGWEVDSVTPGVERWLVDLPDGDWSAGRLPSAVLAVAGRARRAAERPDAPSEIAVSRVLGRSGTWVVLHGVSLVAGGSRRVAVIVEPAHPARIVPLLMTAYGLTQREQDVTLLVLNGHSTTEIADALVVSPHTIQEHLKNIFEKTGVRSRRDLVGKVFFAHYEPRVRDNERRAAQNRPLRGGPVDSRATTPTPS